MNKKEFIFGFFIGIISAVVGSFLYLFLFTKFNSLTTIITLKNEGILGKIITLGTLLNVVIFLICMKYQRETIAKGILLATIVLAIITVLL